MSNGRVAVAAMVMVAAMILGLLAGAGCEPAESGQHPESLAPRIEVMGVTSNHFLWAYDETLDVFVIPEGAPVTLAGSAFQANEIVHIYLDLTHPSDVLLGNLTTNSVGATYGFLRMPQLEVERDEALDTEWECQPPLCDEPYTFKWRACQIKAVVDGEVVATYPMVAHEPWGLD